MLYIRGDTHRQFAGIRVFCAWKKTSKADILIITGDVGINGRNSRQDRILKKELQELPITLFCLRGNHYRRPSSLGSYRESILYGGVVYREEEFPDLLFARSGETYSMNGRQIFVIGGASSSDRAYRLEHGLPWWPDEQLSEAERRYVEQQLALQGWKADMIISHTMPEKYIPGECLQRKRATGNPDLSMERWMDRLEEKTAYRKWYAGHWHVEKQVTDRMEILYQNYKEVEHG